MSVFTAGKTALLTGSASGVGLAVASICRKHGMNLALVDINAAHLARAKEALGSDKVETYEIDVSSITQWQALRSKVIERFGGVDFLMLNAGIGLKGSWNEPEYFDKILNVNLFGQIYGLNTFLDVVKASEGKSAIVMTGSKQGITNPPGNPAYNASKSAIKTLAEHLSFDLRGTQTSVHLLIPGWTFTGLSGGGPSPTKTKPDGAWEPSQVADFLEEKMQQDQFWVICPDNDVSEETDRKRMLWAAGDAVYGRAPLSRWRDDTKDVAQQWMDDQKI